MDNSERLEAIERLTNHRFHNSDLLFQALTHSSYSNERTGDQNGVNYKDNERLEFLGDAVIGLVIAGSLMELFPKATEGKLSRWRSGLVSRRTLAEVATAQNLGGLVMLGRGETRTGGATKRSILAATFEAIVGAIYLDAGMEKAQEFIVTTFSHRFASLTTGADSPSRFLDKKTHLQERIQKVYKTTPQYRVAEAWGPEHEKQFRVEILINGKVIAAGSGHSKKEAEQHAASIAFELMGF